MAGIMAGAMLQRNPSMWTLRDHIEVSSFQAYIIELQFIIKAPLK